MAEPNPDIMPKLRPKIFSTQQGCIVSVSNISISCFRTSQSRLVSSRDVDTMCDIHSRHTILNKQQRRKSVKINVLEQVFCIFSNGLVSVLSLELLEAYNVFRDLLNVSGDVSANHFLKIETESN